MNVYLNILIIKYFFIKREGGIDYDCVPSHVNCIISQVNPYAAAG